MNTTQANTHPLSHEIAAWQKDEVFKRYIQNFFHRKVEAYRKEAVLEIELTNRCGLECPYCGIYSGDTLYDLDPDTLQSAILAYKDHAVRAGFSSMPLSLSGGDPLLYKHFPELLDFLTQQNLPFGLKANASSITEDKLALLKNAPCRVIKITVVGDASIQKTYRGRDTLPVVMEKTALVKRCDIPVVWHFTVGTFNVKNIHSVFHLVTECKPNAIALGRVAHIGKMHAGNTRADTMPPNEYRDFLLDLLAFFYRNKRHGFDVMFREKLWVPLLAELGLLDIHSLPGSDPIRLGCDAYNRLITLTYKGDILSCGLMPSCIQGSMNDPSDTVQACFSKRPLSLDTLSPCHTCAYSAFCRGCRGIALANTGSLYNKDPQCWI